MNSWTESPKRLKYVATVTMGQSPPSAKYGTPERELPFLQGNAEFGSLHPSPIHGCDAATKRCAPDDLLLSVRAPVGAANMADRAYGIGRGLCAITAGDALETRFLWYLAPVISRQLHAFATGSTYEQISAEDVRNATVLVPPDAVQRQIVEFLDRHLRTLDTWIHLKEQLVIGLSQRLSAAIYATVSKLPRNAKLAYSGSWFSGGTPSKDKREFWSGAIPWASTKDLATDELHDTAEHITDDAARKFSRVVPAGSLLIATRGMALAKRLPLAVTRQPMAFNQDLKGLVPAAGIEADYLRLAVRGYQNDLLASVVESAHGTRRLETQSLKALRIPIPTLDTQRRIIDQLKATETRIQSAISALSQQLVLLGERRASLIALAVTGGLDLGRSARGGRIRT